jgi:putative endonuclease
VTTRQDLGDFGERVAAHHLEANGLAIVARKVRVPGGEIDLVAKDGEDVVCVEVRTRRALPGSAAESITAAKLARMWRCAFAYAEQAGVPWEQLRVDVVCIDLDTRGQVMEVAHLAALEAPEGD